MFLKVSVLAGTPWTEQEHRAFLAGLEKLGKVLDNAQPELLYLLHSSHAISTLTAKRRETGEASPKTT